MNDIDILVQIKVGSHLYGTATATSDLDIKGVYIPSARDILLQSIKPVISINRSKMKGEKNTFEDIDYELYSLSKFLNLLAEGQSIALEMIFAPDTAFLSEPHPLWQEIRNFAPKLFSKQAASFVRYCRKQANKYGSKGSRITAARIVLDFLLKAEEQYGSAAKLNVVESQLQNLVTNNEFLSIKEHSKINGTIVRYLDVCGKKADLDASIKFAHQIAQNLINEYGERSLQAERNAGIDWKAISHAVRIGREALEFLAINKLTFPRPEAKYLVEIKNGKIPFHHTSEEIENIIVQLDKELARSTLPEIFDHDLIDNFIERIYRKIVINSEKL